MPGCVLLVEKARYSCLQVSNPEHQKTGNSGSTTAQFSTSCFPMRHVQLICQQVPPWFTPISQYVFFAIVFGFGYARHMICHPRLTMGDPHKMAHCLNGYTLVIGMPQIAGVKRQWNLSVTRLQMQRPGSVEIMQYAKNGNSWGRGCRRRVVVWCYRTKADFKGWHGRCSNPGALLIRKRKELFALEDDVAFEEAEGQRGADSAQRPCPVE